MGLIPTSSLALQSLDLLQMDFGDFLRDDVVARAIRTDLIRECFYYHTEVNPHYDSYVRRLGNLAGKSRASIDLKEIPLIPSSLFKQSDLRLASVRNDEIIKYCCSSGTLGSQSVVPRDDTTLTGFVGSITSSLPVLFGLERTGDHYGVVLGPSTDEAGDLWFSYVMACLTIMVPTEYFEQLGVFHLSQAVDRIYRTIEAGKQLLVIGSPFRLLEVCEKILDERAWPSFPKHSFVISAGGWKNQQAKAIDPGEFRGTVKKAFKMPNEKKIRDSYNMVELNSVITECEMHQKHVPPWVEAQSRDPRTNDVLKAGETGILAFLDPSATSYPSFILSEDFGTVEEGPCDCGWAGQRVAGLRRINRIEARGCALRMSVGSEVSGLTNSNRFFNSVYRSAEPDERKLRNGFTE